MVQFRIKEVRVTNLICHCPVDFQVIHLKNSLERDGAGKMKEVISASRRTDIPAFYLKWFMEHIQKGFIEVTNPFNRAQVRKVDLSPRKVAWIVFWSRNYGPFLKHYRFFDYYQLFFHFTINPADRWLEPDMIPPQVAFKQLEKLVEIYGPDRITWRYDPLVFYQVGEEVRSNHNINVFREYARIAGHLGITRCYTSIMHPYAKIYKRIKDRPDFRFRELSEEQKKAILQEMVEVASLYGVFVYSCSNPDLLKVEGVRPAHCIDGRLLNRLGVERVTERQHHTRPYCGCTFSVDIGDYLRTPCKYHCLYCYARQ